MPALPWPPLEPPESGVRFPDPENAPDDIIGVSRTLTPSMVLQAYRAGIFPWPVRQGVVPWASPEPRALFPLERTEPWPRTLRRARKAHPRVTFDTAFGEVMRTCGALREEGTWITPDILAAYDELHALGWGHSVEVWSSAGELVGGLYGLAVGALFAGESMFHRATDASKAAFVAAVDHCRERGFRIFDVQVLNPHLESLGCITVTRSEYLRRMREATSLVARF